MQIWFVDYDTMSKLILFVLSLFLFSLPKMTLKPNHKTPNSQKLNPNPNPQFLAPKKPEFKTQ